jgi:hypothetical protein
MIRASTADPGFNRAYLNARRALPVDTLESPRQYGQKWRETYRCRVESGELFPHSYYVFDRDEDYTWFMLQWG